MVKNYIENAAVVKILGKIITGHDPAELRILVEKLLMKLHYQ